MSRGGLVRRLVVLSALVSSSAMTVSPAAHPTTCPTMTLTPHDPSYYAFPDGNVGEEYSATITVSGGGGTYFWQLTGGPTPPGLTRSPDGLGGDTLTISGTPTTNDKYGFTIAAGDYPGGHDSG